MHINRPTARCQIRFFDIIRSKMIDTRDESTNSGCRAPGQPLRKMEYMTRKVRSLERRSLELGTINTTIVAEDVMRDTVQSSEQDERAVVTLESTTWIDLRYRH